MKERSTDFAAELLYFYLGCGRPLSEAQRALGVLQPIGSPHCLSAAPQRNAATEPAPSVYAVRWTVPALRRTTPAPELVTLPCAAG